MGLVFLLYPPFFGHPIHSFPRPRNFGGKLAAPGPGRGLAGLWGWGARRLGREGGRVSGCLRTSEWLVGNSGFHRFWKMVPHLPVWPVGSLHPAPLPSTPPPASHLRGGPVCVRARSRVPFCVPPCKIGTKRPTKNRRRNSSTSLVIISYLYAEYPVIPPPHPQGTDLGGQTRRSCSFGPGSAGRCPEDRT